MQVIRKTLTDVIAWETEARFVIPRYQRHYAWGDREVLQMWGDWINDCNRGLKHFCGVMLLRPMGDSAASAWEVVDGQQRMTTFFLFFIALRDICGEQDIDFSELSRVFTLPGSGECRLVLQEGMTEDREILNALLRGTAQVIDRDVLDESALFSAYRTFRNNLGQLVRSEIPTFAVKVLENIDLVILTVDETDDTRRVFEALNSRGKQVSSEELVSNLLTYLNSEDGELNDRSKDVWNFVLNTFDHDDLSSFLDVFSRRSAQQSEKGSVFEEIRFEIENAKKQDRVRDWLREFKRAAQNYCEILNPEETNDPIQKLLKELQRLRVNKLNPFLLALLESFRESPASKPLIHNLLAAVVRLLIIYERPSYRLEQFADRACFAFQEPNVSRNSRLEKVIGLIDEIWIDDERFRAAFAKKNVYGAGAHLSRLRYYLEKLEQKLWEQSGMPFELHFGSDTTIEHVMPQTLDENGAWKSALRFNDPVRLESQHKALVNTIGNLTVLLTKDNPAAGNLPYSQKRDFYLHPDEALNKMGLRKRRIAIGTCALNRYFENIPVWNFQTIATRGQYLADLALQIWNKEDWNRQTQ